MDLQCLRICRQRSSPHPTPAPPPAPPPHQLDAVAVVGLVEALRRQVLQLLPQLDHVPRRHLGVVERHSRPRGARTRALPGLCGCRGGQPARRPRQLGCQCGAVQAGQQGVDLVEDGHHGGRLAGAHGAAARLEQHEEGVVHHGGGQGVGHSLVDADGLRLVGAVWAG